MSWRYKGGFIQEFFDPLTVGPLDTFPLFAWGGNSAGQVGDETLISRSSPVQIGSQTTWANLSSGYAFNGALATSTTGKLFSWGSNNQGQLGQNNTISRSSPTQVGSLTNWSKIYVGASRSILAITTTGTMFGWGKNTLGQLGLNGSLIYLSSPVQVGSDTNWSFAATGDDFSIMGRTNGTLWSAGTNIRGKLGLNLSQSSVYRSSPTQIGSLTSWSAVSCGGDHAVAMQTNGTIWSWGQNGQGQLGQSNTIYRSSPVQIGALTVWSTVACGKNFSAAIKTDGTLWTWGQNSSGQLGQNDTAYKSSPTQVGSLSTWLSVSAGSYNCMAIKTDKTLWSWGGNGGGALGQNISSSAITSSPSQIGSLAIWSNVTDHGNNAFAIQAS